LLAKTVVVIVALGAMIIVGSLAISMPNLDSLGGNNPDLMWLSSPYDNNIEFSDSEDLFSFDPVVNDGIITSEITLQSDTQSFYPHRSTTKLQVSKSATGFFERIVNYDWSITKSVSPTDLTIKKGGPAGTVWFTITATRTKVSDVSTYGVHGSICITNTGSADTENLRIVDKVQYKSTYGSYSDSYQSGSQEYYDHYHPGPPSYNHRHYYHYYHDGFVDVPGSATLVDTSSNPVLSPGERGCYPYTIRFAPPQVASDGYDYDNLLFRNVAIVTITNYHNHAGHHFGPMPVAASFTIPRSPTSLKYYDEHAKLFDIESCPSTFNCFLQNKGQGVGPWLLIGTDDHGTSTYFADIDGSKTITLSHHGGGPIQESASVNFGERLLNSHARCNTTIPLTNTATLIEIDSGQRHIASATALIWTGPCQSHY
jgi:hypothetical protein